MRTYIQEHPSEFIPAGLDPAAAAVAVQDPSSSSSSPAKGEGGDDAASKAREQDRDLAAGCSGGCDTLEGTLTVARQSASGAIELLRDAWEALFST